jgi:hypothetical protein
MKTLFKPEPQLRNGYKDKKRLAAIHNLPCVICVEFGLEQETRTIAHHPIGFGMGKKASDALAVAICDFHHTSGGKGHAIHETPLKIWEEKFLTQERLLELTNQLLGGL